MKKVRFGIIGMGNQGSYYANVLKEGKIDNGILVACCDNNETKLKYAKEKYVTSSIDAKIGDIETSLENIINKYGLGGEAV